MKPNTWDELDKLISEMSENEKPRFEDFPRCNFGRELIDMSLVFETDLTDEEKEIIRQGEEEYKKGDYVSLKSLGT